MDESEDEEVLLLCLLLRRRRRRLRALNRQTWTKRWIMRRQGQGAYANLVKELNAEEPEQFRQYHRMDRQSFESILAMVNTLIVKHDTQMRFAISPRERLTVTLRFLATGQVYTHFYKYTNTSSYYINIKYDKRQIVICQHLQNYLIY